MDRDFTVNVLPDQSRLLLIPMRECQTFTLYMAVRYGSNDVFVESDYENAHFLEHLFAELTSKQFPNAKSNTMELAKYGIEWNAYTYDDHTVYVYKGLTVQLNRILLKLICAYNSFTIDENVFEQERSAVVNELKGHMSLPTAELNEVFYSYIYQDNEVLKKMTLNTECENVKKTGITKLMQVWDRYYHGSNVLFTLAGGFEPRSVLRFFERSIKPSGIPQVVQRKDSFHKSNQPTEIVVNMKSSQVTRIRITWILDIGWSDYDQFVKLDVLSFILFGGLNSRLYRRLRGELGVVYSVGGSCNSNESDQTLFTISTQVGNPDHKLIVLDSIVNELENFAPMSAEELVSTKNTFTFELLETQQRGNAWPEFWIETYYKSILFNKPAYNRKKYQYALDNLKNSDINDFVLKNIRPHNRVTVCGVPT